MDRTDVGRANEQARKQDYAAEAGRVEAWPAPALASTAVSAVNGLPAIRADKVEAARKALAEGTLGSDAGKLADILIDHMLDSTQQ